MLGNGDDTVIGESGISLSGGQKVRLALARMLYGDADIYMFDDPFSSLDAKVANKVYENAIFPLIGNKTIILVTHHLDMLKSSNKLL